VGWWDRLGDDLASSCGGVCGCGVLCVFELFMEEYDMILHLVRASNAKSNKWSWS
jgi:hypothetical protein